MFATHAKTVLKKEPTLGWKPELNNQIAVFHRICQDAA
jgi:hypothetical protein